MSPRRRCADGSSCSTSEMACPSARYLPAVTSSASAIGQEISGDDHPLDLGGPFANRAELHVAIVLLGREVFHETVAAEDLHSLFRTADGDLGGVELRHRRELRD